MARALSNLLGLRCRCWSHRDPGRATALVDEEDIRQLRERWIECPERVTAILADIRAGNDWTQNLLAGTEWPELPRLRDCPSVDSFASDKVPRDLRGLRLSKESFEECAAFANSYMNYCILEDVCLTGGSLVATSMDFAEMRGSCVFAGTKMRNTTLRHALCGRVSFRGADLKNATLQGTDLSGADLRDAEFRDTDLRNVTLVEEPWYGHLLYRPLLVLIALVLSAILLMSSSLTCFISLIIPLYVLIRCREWWTRFGGELQSTGDITPDPGIWIRRFVSNGNHRRSTQQEHPIFGTLSYILSDCGLSSGRVLFWIFVVWCSFAVVYAAYPLPSYLEGTFIEPMLHTLAPTIDWAADEDKVEDKRDPSWFEPYYFSVVTMTTLGYGDIGPAPKDTQAQIYICLEAAAGYLLLAALVATLFNRHSA